MENTNKIIGANLKKLRELFDETQESLAEKVGVSRSAYSNYESGLREVPYDVLERASVMFGCDTYALFDKDLSIKDDVLVCAFRVDNFSEDDFNTVCQFKDIVRSYLKMNRIAND